jgi:hypothetical protein
MRPVLVDCESPNCFYLDYDQPFWDMAQVLASAEVCAARAHRQLKDVKHISPSLWLATLYPETLNGTN